MVALTSAAVAVSSVSSSSTIRGVAGGKGGSLVVQETNLWDTGRRCRKEPEAKLAQTEPHAFAEMESGRRTELYYAAVPSLFPNTL